MKKSLLCFTFFAILLIGCSSPDYSTSYSSSPASSSSATSENSKNDKVVKMPYSSDDYLSWSVDDLKSHLMSLGFTSDHIDTYAIDPNAENYDREILEIGTLSGMEEWEKGAEIHKNDVIIISYNKAPLITPNNNSDIQRFLTGDGDDYLEVAEQFDGCTLCFDGTVSKNLNNAGSGILFVVYTTGGSEVELTGFCYSGTNDSDSDDVNFAIDEGESVTVVGTIDADKSDYYGRLYLHAIVIKRR